jgi:limonene-1,2-epoxide hydrolase
MLQALTENRPSSSKARPAHHNATPRSGLMTTEADHVVRRFVAGWGRADIEELLEYFAEDAVWHPMPMKPAVGKAALRKAFGTWLAGTVQGGAEILEQVSDGKIVMHERTDRFSFGGQEHVLPVCAVFEIENGRITAWREYFDMSSFADSDESDATP